jgi:hypothetical protein
LIGNCLSVLKLGPRPLLRSLDLSRRLCEVLKNSYALFFCALPLRVWLQARAGVNRPSLPRDSRC